MFGKSKNNNKNHTSKSEVVRVNGKLNEVTTIHDSKGNILHKVMSPLMVEFHSKDLAQVVVGSTILAIPLVYTQETWDLGMNLPFLNVIGIMLLSIFFISIFVYYNYYHDRLKKHKEHFFRRVFFTYFLAFFLVAVLLSLIGKTPWTTDILLAIKRVIIVSFPASMSAAITDSLK